MVLILSVLAIPMFGCCEELEECETDLAQTKTAFEQCGIDLAACLNEAFTLVVELDGMGTFQPFNNQFRNMPVRPHRDGMFIQIGDFADANHPYLNFELKLDDGTTQEYTRGANLPVWVDVQCGATQEPPITKDIAKTLAPVVGDPSTHNRRLHVDLDPDAKIVPVTLWAAESGIKLRTKAEQFGPDQSPVGEEGHGHVKFTFGSAEACAVQVWTDWESEPDTYPSDTTPQVTEIIVHALYVPQHGGPHQPPWEF
jgi:hypothetical protein